MDSSIFALAGSVCFATMMFALVPGLFVFLIYYSIKKGAENRQKWHQAAMSLGFEHRHGKTFWGTQTTGPMLGKREGFDVRITTFTRSSGEHSSTHTSVEVLSPTNMNLGLHITPEGFFTGVSKMFGTQDIQVGDRTFDDVFLIKGNRPADIIALLNPAVRQQLLTINAQHGSIKLTDQGTYQEWDGMITDAHRLASLIAPQVRLMTQLEQAHSARVMANAEVGAAAW